MIELAPFCEFSSLFLQTAFHNFIFTHLLFGGIAPNIFGDAHATKMRAAHATEMCGLRALMSLLPSNSTRSLRGLARLCRLTPSPPLIRSLPLSHPSGFVYLARPPSARFLRESEGGSGFRNIQIFADFLRGEIDDLAMTRNGRRFLRTAIDVDAVIGYVGSSHSPPFLQQGLVMKPSGGLRI